MNELYENGDLVVINCDSNIVYTIMSIYGEGRYAICGYRNDAGDAMPELSIPLVSITRYQNPSFSAYLPVAHPPVQQVGLQA